MSFLLFGLVGFRLLLALYFPRLLSIFKGLGVLDCFTVASFTLTFLGLGLLSAELSFVAFSLATGFFIPLAFAILVIELTLLGVIFFAAFAFCGIFFLFAGLSGCLIGIVLRAGLETALSFQFLALRLSLVLQLLVTLFFVQKG